MEKKERVTRNIKRDTIILAAILIVVGVLFIIFPNESSSIICYTVGIGLILWGIIGIISYFAGGDQFEAFTSYGLVKGVAFLVVGIMIVVNPDILKNILTSVFGIVLVIDSAIKLQYAVDSARLFALMHKDDEPGNKPKPKWPIILIIALVTAVLGILVIMNPFGAINVLFIFAGISLIVDGLTDLAVIFLVSRFAKENKKEAEEPKQIEEQNEKIETYEQQ